MYVQNSNISNKASENLEIKLNKKLNQFYSCQKFVSNFFFSFFVCTYALHLTADHTFWQTLTHIRQSIIWIWTNKEEKVFLQLLRMPERREEKKIQ